MTYHFIGLGGIGMSALARILLQKGEKVQGSDQKESGLLDQLGQEGAVVFRGHSAESIPLNATVIYSTDIKVDNVEMMRAKEKNLPLLHRSDLLHELMKGKKTCLVTGTHGKTTTTALLASVLIEAALDPSFVIGGLIRSLNVNGRAGKGEYFIAEADESDGSFLKTAADYAIVTNLENDHLDYWGTPRMLDLAFRQFMAQTKHLVWCCDDSRLSAIKPSGISYGFSEDADFRLSHFRTSPNGIVFNLNAHLGIHLNLLGRHNALNGAAVFAMALQLGVPEEIIRRAFQTFSGTSRRLEWKGEKHKVSLYDDYGHHPSEISVTLKALRAHIGERRLVVVFQPHRYTRVRDLLQEFTSCFAEADEVLMTDIYSARESPIEGITSASLYTRMREKLGSKLHFFPRSHLEIGAARFLKPLDVVLTLGAGDVTHAGAPILDQYAIRAPKFTVAVLFGGSSAEYPVSIMSASNILKGLDASIYDIRPFHITQDGKWERPLEELLQCDVSVPVFHGPKGEDGMMGALFDVLSIPYVGCDYRSGSICMQKAWTKYVAMGHGVPTAPFVEIGPVFQIPFSYPVWVKPVHLGSSIGVSRAENEEELHRSIEFARKYDDVIIVEKEVVGRQIEFAVLGNNAIRIAPPGEIINHGDFVAYDKKYGAGAMEIRVPAELTETERETGLALAETMYRACGCKGLARVDFFLDAQGKYWFNEINPFPGFTDTSAYPKMWKAAGMTMELLTDELIALAFHRSRQ